MDISSTEEDAIGKVVYDEQAKASYVQLNKNVPVKQVVIQRDDIQQEIILDVDQDGNLVGIELLY